MIRSINEFTSPSDNTIAVAVAAAAAAAPPALVDSASPPRGRHDFATDVVSPSLLNPYRLTSSDRLKSPETETAHARSVIAGEQPASLSSSINRPITEQALPACRRNAPRKRPSATSYRKVDLQFLVSPSSLGKLYLRRTPRRVTQPSELLVSCARYAGDNSRRTDGQHDMERSQSTVRGEGPWR